MFSSTSLIVVIEFAGIVIVLLTEFVYPPPLARTEYVSVAVSVLFAATIFHETLPVWLALRFVGETDFVAVSPEASVSPAGSVIVAVTPLIVEVVVLVTRTFTEKGFGE